eukprot:XP_017946953.1 PREDICTED: dehydrogenase/reductase SDR family member on chromosome X isoform X3 [Xenopus tropicalis]
MWLRAVLLPILRVYYTGLTVILQQVCGRRAFSLPVIPSQNGKVAIVTGGAKGIGYSTAKHLSSLGMHVIIAGNNEAEGSEAVTRIQQDTHNEKVEFLYCDLASMKSIRQFVQIFKAKNLCLHVLVNNAGVMLVPERKTADGFEEHFGLNYLGHFLLTNLLLKTTKESGTENLNARIITVSSATHYVGELNFDDLNSRLQRKEQLHLFMHQSLQSWKESEAVICTMDKKQNLQTSHTTRICKENYGMKAARWLEFLVQHEALNGFHPVAADCVQCLLTLLCPLEFSLMHLNNRGE